MSKFYKNENFVGWFTIFLLFFGFIFAFFNFHSEEDYFPEIEFTVIDEKTGEVIKDGVGWACWDAVRTIESMYILPKDGKFIIPARKYTRYLKFFGKTANLIRFGFCNPYYLLADGGVYLDRLDLPREKDCIQRLVTSKNHYNDTVLWDFLKNKGQRPPTQKIKLKTKKIMEALDLLFPDQMPLSYITLAHEMGIKYNLIELEKCWFDYIKLRFGNDPKKYNKMLSYTKELIDFYANFKEKNTNKC